MVCEILIVDDDRDIRDVLSVALAADGHAVKATDSLLGALDVLKDVQSSNSCMLLDYNLPGMRMDEFLAKARAKRPKIGVVMISAVDDLQKKATRYGISHSISKPINFQKLRETVATVLND